MRTKQKRDILEMIGTLHQAHDEIKRYIESNQYTMAQDMLAQCQECAVSIGTAIESFEGEGFITVSYIEEYCEALYRIHQSFECQEGFNANKIYKILRKQILKIENSVKSDVSVRKEIVFLPYKASMWDSLESVWKAADSDPDCDAYVIPVPYYDKNPDGSFRQMHYEGNLYPKYVPVTYYENFDFEVHHPDIIYIHNPYDEYNYVTSVDPFFYSGNLKKYTDKLVYIPYFIMGKVSPNKETTIESKAHYCTSSAVLNANEVIVESEDVRQLYINTLIKTYGKESRSIWENKIYGLGSPKIDKVLSTKKEDLEIPDEWMDIIQKPDGSWKKIVLYNVTVSTFLNSREKILKKMKSVFSAFKENQDRVALLWRPHPLTRATISSMVPHILEEYEEMVRQYLKEGWGIYDDSADMDRAVILSDVYYGDRSSVVYLYQKMGKKIMLQSIEEYEWKIFFYDWIWEDREIIYPLANYNALCKTDIATGRTTIMSRADEENIPLLFSGIYKWESYLLLSGSAAKRKLTLYNLCSDEWSYISVDEDKKNWLNFREEDVFEQGDSIYIISYFLIIFKVNIEKNSVEYLFYPDMKPEGDVRSEVVRVNNIIYIPMRHNNKIYKFDLETEQIEIIAVNTELKGIDTLCFDGERFWMTGTEKMICSWDEKSNSCISYCNFPHNFKKFHGIEGEDGYWFCRSGVYEKKIYFIPCYANMLLELDTNTYNMEEIFIPDEEESAETIRRPERFFDAKFSAAKKRDNMLMLVSAENKNLILIDLNTKKIDKVEFEMQYKDGIDILLKDEKIFYKDVADIGYIIRHLDEISCKNDMSNTEKLCGGEIHLIVADKKSIIKKLI